MWVVTALVVQMFAAPSAWVVTQAGSFDTKEACEAAIASAVPSKLEADDLKRYEDGFQVYQCVKAIGPNDHEPPVK
ncbi:hypothetical protein [Amorphus coralli]|uniref:hypothetical protein n=1 Tax=Amorphus coralli TaxID=340680 RepID=UPI000382F174|nr:hypothetical protein [Amorphus coralli]